MQGKVLCVSCAEYWKVCSAPGMGLAVGSWTQCSCMCTTTLLNIKYAKKREKNGPRKHWMIQIPGVARLLYLVMRFSAITDVLRLPGLPYIINQSV